MKTMNRIVAFVLVLAMAISLAACGANTAQEAAVQQTQTAQQDTQNTPQQDTAGTAQQGSGQAEAPQTAELTSVSIEKEQSDTVTMLTREEKELVVELVSGQSDVELTEEELGELTDEELDELIDQLVDEIGEEVVSDLTPGGETPEDPSVDPSENPGAYDEDGGMNKPFDEVYPELIEEEKVSFSGESILIKLKGDTHTDGLKAAGVGALEEIVPMGDAAWYEAKLTEGTDPKAAIAAVRELDEVLLAEYNYEIQVAALDEYKSFDEETAAQLAHNDRFEKQWHFHHGGIVDGYQEMKTNGGDPSVVVAVIDTGVDYDHEDLKDNMWVNTGEIPDNGIDDDGNGYIDDYYGVDLLTKKGSGDDTNGHGTHVAGIIAARNNNVGTLGIAYNVKIMSIKAAAHNGTLNQSDIAKAVLYAYENGAEVINMSFGGTACSIAVQDALATAYTRCVLVASAGNNGAYNEGFGAIPNYPAALTYVLGVMSVDETGRESVFTNYDVFAFSGVEYELYAPGENIMSTLPNNQYGYLSGTSMAAPVVSAYAAILRSEYTDRDKYPTKFIYGQLASTSENHADCLDPELHGPHNLPQIANLYTALTKLPKPEVNLQGYALFDDPSLSEKNNGDGVIDAGETIALGLTLRNRWGMSENTQVTIDTLSLAGIEDPYITIQNPTVNYGSVGTYSTQDCGRIVENDEFVGWEHPFLITVSEDCPNDYRITFNVTITCENALDEEDTTVYSAFGTVNEAVRSGYLLPSVIDQDMVLTSDSLYIISRPTVIQSGVTVRVEPGTHIQFWSDDPNDPYAESGIAYLQVKGSFFVEGTKEDPVYIYPSELMSQYNVDLGEASGGVISLRYADITNLHHYNTSSDYGITYAGNCTFRQNYGTSMYYRYMSGGNVSSSSSYVVQFGQFDLAEKCVFYKVGTIYGDARLLGTMDTCIFVDSATSENPYYAAPAFRNCVFLGNAVNDQTAPNSYNNSSYNISGSPPSLSTEIFYDRLTGTTYVRSSGYGDFEHEGVLAYIRSLGGDYAVYETREEFDRIQSAFPGAYSMGITYDWDQKQYVFADGSPLPDYLLQEGVTDGFHGLELRLDVTEGVLDTGSRYSSLFEIPGPILPEEITFDRYQLLLDTESTVQLRPLNTPVQLPPESFLYESSDGAVVTVSETGLVTPVGLGTADVWVYSQDRAVKNHVTITVKEYLPLQAVSFPMEAAETFVGESIALPCVLEPADTTRQIVTYSSSDPDVAQVDSDGNITGIASGTAVITAASAEKGENGEPISASITVTVYNKATSLKLGTAAISAALADGSMELPQVLTSDGAETVLSWRSTDEAVASVEEGVLKLNASGTTSLIVTDSRSGLSAVCLVVVSETRTSPITDVQVSDGVCAVLMEDGSLYRWNNNNFTLPTLLANEVRMIELVNGACYMVLCDGTIQYCYSGSTQRNNLTEKFKDKEIAELSVCRSNGSSYFVVIGDNAYAWGDNYKSRLGVGHNRDVTEPELIQLDGVVDVVSDTYVTYFLTSDGKMYGAGSINGEEIAQPTLLCEGVVQIGHSGIFLTEDGRWGYHYIYSDSLNFFSTELSGLDQVALAASGGIGIKDGRAYTFTGDTQPQEVPGVTDAVTVFTSGTTHYIYTESGILLGFGKNDDNQIPGASAGTVETPTPILLNSAAEDRVSVIETNLAEDVLSDNTLQLTFNKQIYSASPKLYKNGDQITGKSVIADYNHMTISRSAGFEVGTTYELVFPAGNIIVAGGITNPEEIRISFTYLTDLAITEDPEVPENPVTSENPEQPVIHESQLDESIQRYMTADSVKQDAEAFLKATRYNPAFTGNAILNPLVTDTNVSRWLRVQAPSASDYTEISAGGNWWGTTNETQIDRQIIDYADYPNYARVMFAPYLTEAPENTFPFVTDLKLFNKAGEEVTTVGNETVTFRVSFNRDMDTSIPLLVRFGSAYPYGDYEVEGQYVDARTWEGTYTLNTLIENGYQFFTISEGCTADGELDLQVDRHRFMFEIDTTAAQALIMQGTSTDTGIQLSWTQDDFDTLMGYNVYRSTKEDGLYTRLNETVIPAGTMEWFDDTVEPGVIYYYNFTVVKTDLTESVPSGKIVIMSKDTMAPNIYHSPVTGAFTGSNLVINATITDNLNIAYANLYYRVTGTESWTTIRMNKLNDKYSAIVPAASVTTAGLEYYIEAFDGISYTYKGSAEEPLTVAVQEAVDANSLGDVDGDGAITIRDALLVLYAINDKYNLTEEEFARADLNGDGELWAAEALRILQYVNGVVGSVKM